jgi:type I restriction enzyme S subunit
LTFGDKKMAIFSIIKLSELEGAKRIDAEYYKPEYLEIKQRLLQTKFVYFRDLVKEIIHPKEIKREYEEEKQDYLFLLAQNVRPLMLDLSEKKYISEEKAKQMPKNLLEKGDILFIRTGAVGDSTVYTGEPPKVIASGFFQFRPLNILPEVLLVLSKTIILQLQLKKRCSGTILTAVPKESLRDIIIPIIPLSIQQEIASLVQQSHEARKKAKELLEIAKRAVEIAIENSESEALDYISKHA